MSSAVLAPVAAASVAPVWRSSCTRTGGNPHASTARRKVAPKFDRARKFPEEVPKTSASTSGGTCSPRWASTAAATNAGRITVRIPASVFGGPTSHRPPT